VVLPSFRGVIPLQPWWDPWPATWWVWGSAVAALPVLALVVVMLLATGPQMPPLPLPTIAMATLCSRQLRLASPHRLLPPLSVVVTEVTWPRLLQPVWLLASLQVVLIKCVNPWRLYL
jgi:hypothetical protein